MFVTKLDFKNFFLIFFLAFFILTPTVFAQSTDDSQSVQGAATLGVAHSVETKLKDLKDGSILSSGEHGAILSNTPYDSQVLGVVARDAGITFGSDETNTVPVISVGTVYILVSTKAGAIKKGDLLATSTTPGVAVKAVKNGYVLGAALEDDNNPDHNQIDKIVTSLNLHYFNTKPTFAGSLTDILKLAILPTKDSPSPIFKYIVAAAVVMSSLVLGFVSFGRTAAKGVEALGRNPSANKIIHLGIIFNVMIVAVIAFAGLTVAFLILRL
jgi:F0F1-type ATP synthase membrane subunit c/vacuolar-type H+-ATPase subunit K